MGKNSLHQARLNWLFAVKVLLLCFGKDRLWRSILRFQGINMGLARQNDMLSRNPLDDSNFKQTTRQLTVDPKNRK